MISCLRTVGGPTVPPLRCFDPGVGAGWMVPCLSSRRRLEAEGALSGSSTFQQPGSSRGWGLTSIDWAPQWKVEKGGSLEGWGKPLLLLLPLFQIEFYVNKWIASLHLSTFCHPRKTKFIAHFGLKAVNQCDSLRVSNRFLNYWNITLQFIVLLWTKMAAKSPNEAAGFCRPAAPRTPLSCGPKPPETRAQWAKLHRIRRSIYTTVSCGWTFTSGPQRGGELYLF